MTADRPDFETIDHTADVGLVVRGPTLPALFANAARGMFHIIAGDVEVEPKSSEDVEIEAPDREALLVVWLNELIFRFETQHVVYGRFDIRDVSDERLTAVVAGQSLDEIDEPLEMELKAATYHGLRVEQTANGWEAEVLFDV